LTAEEAYVPPSCAADMITASASTGSAAEEQEDCCQEHGGPGSPGETECIPADVGGETGVAESIAGFDEHGTLGVLGGFYVIGTEGDCGDLRHEGGCESEPEECKAEGEA
jgi:hypothetical protein